MSRVCHNATENAVALYASTVVLALGIHAGAIYGLKRDVASICTLEAETKQTEVELFERASQSEADVSKSAPLEPSSPPAPRKDTIPLEPPEAPPKASPTETPYPSPAPSPAPTPPAITAPDSTAASESVRTPPVVSPLPSSRQRSFVRIGASTKTGAPSENSTTRSENADKTLGRPVYKVPPLVKYPAESRSAGEQGIVLLRIRANAEGKPVEVTVITSSGFSRLDRAAVEGAWKSRIDHAFEGAQFDAPLRFSLKN